MNKWDTVYYAQIMPNVDQFNVLELKVRMIGDTWFSAIEKDSARAYIFNTEDLDKTVFYDRGLALNLVLTEEMKHDDNTLL